MKYLGLDIGTTRMKCGIYDDSGKLKYTSSIDYGHKSRGAEFFIDIESIKDSALKLLNEAYKSCPYDSISVSSLGESFVVLGENDQVLFLPMLYTDGRGKEQAEEMSNYKEKFFDIAGVYPQGLYSAFKLMWIKENKPEIYGKAKKVLLVNEYITYTLTGVRAIDYSSASRTALFNVREKKFSSELIKLCGLNEELFSPTIACGKVIGDVKPEIKKAWGAETVKVVSGGHDQVCATVGSSAVNAGDCSDGMGTVECMTTVYNEPSYDQTMGSCGYPNVAFAVDGLYCTYLLNYSCGSLNRWWIESVYDIEDVKSGKAFTEIEKEFTESPTGILVLPYFAGASTPYQNIDAKGGILNLTLNDSISRVYQGILEGLCYEMRLNLEKVKKYGIRPKRIVATGGGSSSSKWLQMKADILKVPVYPLINKEAGICGAAILGCSALTGKSIQEVSKKFVKCGKPFRPRKEISKLYDTEYKKYRTLYKDLKKYY